MKTEMKRRDAIKTVIAATGGLLAAKSMASEPEPASDAVTSFAGTWYYEGQPCAIFQQGPILLVVQEGGALATAHVTGADTFVIWSGSGWDSGLEAQLTNRGTTINWADGSVWTKTANQPGVSSPVTSFAGTWYYEGQPCAIFQQGAILLVVQEGGALATAHVTGADSFVIWSGSGWDSGLEAQLTNRGTTINWADGSVWTKAAN